MKKILKLKDSREIVLLGTAHVSSKSVEEVRESLDEIHPDVVCVELDKAREESLKKEDNSWLNLDIISVIKRGRLFFLFVQVILSSFQKRVAKENGIQAGDDMKEALEWSVENQIPVALIDRDVNITLKRAWRKSSFFQKLKLMTTLFSSIFDGGDSVNEQTIEELKQEDMLSHLMEEMARDLPVIKSVLIDERDAYLACSLWQQPYEKVVAVLGAGHLEGVERYLQQEEMSQENAYKTLKELNEIPPSSSLSKIIPWSITFIFAIALGWVFYKGGASLGWEGIKGWVLVNGGLASLGAILSLAHPLTWVVSFVGAPFTSLTPFIGVGMLAALTEAYLRKPRVKDFLDLSDDIGTLKGFFHNRIAHIFIIFMATSLGSSIGTFWGIGILAALGIG